MARTAEILNGETLLSVRTKLNSIRTDTMSQTDTTAQAVASDLNFAATKRPKADLFYFNPAAAPANTEGHLYYDNTAKCLKLRTAAAWEDIPGVAGGGGSYRFPYQFMVEKIGSNYVVRDADGAIQYNSTSLEVALNDVAFAGLTGGRTSIETVVVKGECVVDDTVLLDPYTRLDLSQARWTAATNLNKAMISENGAPASGCIEILGGIIDGNHDNQSGTTHGIVMDMDQKNSLRITDTWVGNMKGYCYDLVDVAQGEFTRIHAQAGFPGTTHSDYGIRLQDVFDSEFTDVKASSFIDGYCLHLADHFCVSNTFKGCYWGGGLKNVVIDGASRQWFIGCNNNDSYEDGYVIGDETSGAFDIQIIGGKSENNSWRGTADGSDILVEDNANRVIVLGHQFYSSGGDASEYGFEEKDNADYNMVCNNIFTGQTAASRVIVGVNDVVQHNIG